MIVGVIARDYTDHVRVGAANAGHTIWVDGEKHVQQQIPCAAYANPYANLYIGPGAQISDHIFEEEVNRWQSWRGERGLPFGRIVVDPRAHVITGEHIEREQRSGLAERIGSTSTIAREGIGAAQAARVMREAECVTAGDYFNQHCWLAVELADVPQRLAMVESGVLLEGTQGTGLSLTTGPFPYVTSRNTTAAGLAADAGIAPNRLDRVILVCRTYPIRVAGNSGPFWFDSEEISWDDIGIDPEKERTTVTKKVRRVASFSVNQVAEAAALNGATEIALTFCDYLDPVLYGASGVWERHALNTYPKVGELVREIEGNVGRPVTMLGTGPHSVIRLDRSC